MELLETHILYDLIDSSLKKRGINSHHRDQSPKGQTCGKSHRMFLSNTHVEKSVWEHITESFQSGPVRHCRCDSHYFFLPVSEFPHDRRKNIGVVGLSMIIQGNPMFQIKGCGTVESGRMAHGRFIASSFLGLYMDQHRPLNLSGLLKYLDHSGTVMAVYRSQISDSHIFKKHSGNDQAFHTVFRPVDLLHRSRSDPRNPVQTLFHFNFQVIIAFCSPQISQITGDSPYVFGNRHFVVIQHDHKIGFQL